MSSYWFKPKAYGYGATPANWKGWAVTFAFVAVVATATIVLLAALQPDRASGFAPWQFAVWGAGVALLTLGFIRLCRAKTDGQWGWRWGK